MTFSFSNDPLFVNQGQTVQFRYKAPPQWDFTDTVSIRIGLLEQFWFITTIPEDFAPVPFVFFDIFNVELDTLFVYADGSRPGEELITVNGLTPTTEVPVSLSASYEPNINDYAIRIIRNGQTNFETRIGITDGQGWFIPNFDTTVENGDRIQARLRSSKFASSEARLNIAIGSANENWVITTKAEDPNIPVPFPDFNDLFNIEPGTDVYSNIIRVQGLREPALVSVDNLDAKIGISPSNASFTNDDGYEVLSNTDFVDSLPTTIISNGQFLQLKFTTPFTDSITSFISLSIGDKPNGSVWSVTNGIAASTSPNSFTFIDLQNVDEDSLIASDAQPLFGITGLGNNDIEVPVVLLNTNGTEPRVQIIDRDGNQSSIGVFPAKVKNGFKIRLYNRSSSTFGGSVTTQIKVGRTEIPTWTIVTNNGPDTDAIFTPPPNLINRKPSTPFTSAIVAVTGINRSIQINATNGALISIDFDQFIPGPRTFDPKINKSFQISLVSPSGLSQTASTQVTVGTGTANNPFTWSVTTFAVAPPPKTNLGRWYSKKTDKFDGYSIGTIISVPKEGDGTYGDLAGNLNSRYPSFLECNGSSYDVSRYPDLWWVIGNTYGGNGAYNSETKTYSGTFKVPDYRNRKMTGLGIVDGNRGSSAFVPVSTVGKGIFDVGAEGGYWYVDTVDVSGPLPFEQIIGEVGAQTGQTSPFFTLGSPTTVFDSPVTGETDFTIVGSITGLVGPLTSVIVSAPPHTHFYITARVEGDGGDPLIPWGENSLLATPDVIQDRPSKRTNPRPPQTEYLQVLKSLLPNLEQQLAEVDGADSLEDIVSRLVSSQAFGRRSEEIVIKTWFLSPFDSIPSSQLINVRPNDGNPSMYAGANYGDASIQPTGNTFGVAVIDTETANFSVQPYPPTGSVTASHSHLITPDPVLDPSTDFSYDVGGVDVRNGLGRAFSTLNVTFNQEQVQNSMNTGTFTLNSTFKKPVPNVTFVPNRKVPLVPSFHKVKYLIKAY